MSKKHKKISQNQAGEPAVLTHAAEYRIIKNDLVKVIVLNAIYLVGVLAIYYSNLKTGYLENWFSKMLHF